MKLSVLICCADAADTLPAALASVMPWADEVLVVDSGSKDATPQLALDAGARVVEEPWRGYSEQKEFGITLTRNPWTFVLDGDEEADSVLQHELCSFDEGFDRVGGPRLDAAKELRLRPVGAGVEPGLAEPAVPPRPRELDGPRAARSARGSRPGAVRRLKGHLLHKRTSSAGFGDYFSGARLDARLLMQARQMHAAGKRASFFDLAVRPPATVFKQLVIKRGLLDGSFGWMMAQKTAATTQLKYAALKAVEMETQPPRPPDPSGDS